MSLQDSIRISLSVDFLKAFACLPVTQQKKVREFVQLFQTNPRSSGINYESIQGTSDPNLKSVRIDNTYRAIIASPNSGNVYFLLWVAKHDDAYTWAVRKRLLVHPNTGGLQLVQIEEKVEIKPETTKIPGLFDTLTDEQLIRLGVPSELLSRVRKIILEDDLELAEEGFPQEAYNALFLYACGSSYDSILREYERVSSQKVDTKDFWSALDNEDSASRFKVIDDALELESILNAPLEQWRVFLHPLQRKLVEMRANGPVRVLGNAGTGKTVVAIHRAKWLAENIFNHPNDRILFTTFTKNLASDIQEYLKCICPLDILKRIDVQNLDAWAMNFLEKNGYKSRLDHNGTIVWSKK